MRRQRNETAAQDEWPARIRLQMCLFRLLQLFKGARLYLMIIELDFYVILVGRLTHMGRLPVNQVEDLFHACGVFYLKVFS